MTRAQRHKYDYDIDVESDTASANVLRLVGTNKRVLELGAGPGSITRVLRTKAGCTVTALEIDIAAIEMLRPFCDRVYRIDLNDANWGETLRNQQPFDVIVAADVLEHLYDPLQSLMIMRTLIADDGYLVVSLPHVSHSAVIASLANEDFEYRDWGLLDRTHIRFFGIRNIQNIVEQAGLKIVEAAFVCTAPEETELADQWIRSPARLREALAANRFGFVYQVVFKALPDAAPGQPLNLMSLPVPKAAIEGRAPSYRMARIVRRIRAWVKTHTPPDTRTRLRRFAARFGVDL